MLNTARAQATDGRARLRPSRRPPGASPSHALLAALCVMGLLAATSRAAEPQIGVELSTAFDGWFRPGLPVEFILRLTNHGAAFRGELDLEAEGIVWRQPIALGADAETTVRILAAVHTATSPVTVRVRDSDGQPRLELTLQSGLRAVPAGGALVAYLGGAGAVEGALREDGIETVMLKPGGLPKSGAAYLALDALVTSAGASSPVPVPPAIENWVRGGGTLTYRLRAGTRVAAESLLARASGVRGGRPAAEWWADAAKGAMGGSAIASMAWPHGLGRVAAVFRTSVDAGIIALARHAADRRAKGDVTVAPEIYKGFVAPAWSQGSRWRLTGAALAMLIAVVAVALAVPRAWGAWRRVAAIVAAAAALTAVCWWLVLPAGPGVLDVVRVDEAARDGAVCRRTGLACLTGISDGQVTLTVDAGTLAPLYYEASDAGSWRDVVVATDSDGRQTVTCPVRRGVRRCFIAWGLPGEERPRADRVGEGGGARAALPAEAESLRVRAGRFADGDAWRPLRTLRRWEALQRAVLSWQARRRPSGAFRASWQTPDGPSVQGKRLLERREHPSLRWVEEAGDGMGGRSSR